MHMLCVLTVRRAPPPLVANSCCVDQNTVEVKSATMWAERVVTFHHVLTSGGPRTKVTSHGVPYWSA